MKRLLLLELALLAGLVLAAVQKWIVSARSSLI
jgi:hypothetical protein